MYHIWVKVTDGNHLSVWADFLVKKIGAPADSCLGCQKLIANCESQDARPDFKDVLDFEYILRIHGVGSSNTVARV